MISIKKDLLNKIVNHAQEQLPIEACGYLAGNNGLVTHAFNLRNIDNSPEHFSFDAKEQFNVVRQIRDLNLEIIANYHSHPGTPARPSEEDKRLAYDPLISYVIISLANKQFEIKSFRIINKEAEKEELLIVE
jgi:[CysO sulfur-carrier protein]-S-L-cysteine hydrolase